jgi:hypothetical protein
MTEHGPEEGGSGKVRARAAGWTALLGVLLFTLPGLLSLQDFFYADDWPLLAHYGTLPLSRLGQCFSPAVVWFYRPLQALHLCLFYHAFGLEPLPYNVVLIALHLACCAAAFYFLWGLTGRPSLAAGTVVVFAGLWITSENLVWKCNLNTKLWALVTLLACAAFDSYLRTGRERARWSTYALAALNFLTKESAVNLVLLLGLVWLYREGTAAQLRSDAWRGFLRRGARLLGPVVLLTAAYVAVHRALVHDVYGGLERFYRLVSPGGACLDLLYAYQRPLFGVAPEAQLLPGLPWLPDLATVFVERVGVLLPLLLLLSWRWRDRVLLFGTVWFAEAFLPVILVVSFDAVRQYFLPTLGLALAAARLGERAWRAAARWRGLRGSVGRALLVAGTACFAMAHLSTTLLHRDFERAGAARVERAYTFLAAQRGSVAPGTLVLVRGAGLFTLGVGARELVRMALDDPSADGVAEGEAVPPPPEDRPPPSQAYELDLQAASLRLKPISVAAAQACRAPRFAPPGGR